MHGQKDAVDRLDKRRPSIGRHKDVVDGQRNGRCRQMYKRAQSMNVQKDAVDQYAKARYGSINE